MASPEAKESTPLLTANTSQSSERTASTSGSATSFDFDHPPTNKTRKKCLWGTVGTLACAIGVGVPITYSILKPSEDLNPGSGSSSSDAPSTAAPTTTISPATSTLSPATLTPSSTTPPPTTRTPSSATSTLSPSTLTPTTLAPGSCSITTHARVYAMHGESVFPLQPGNSISCDNSNPTLNQVRVFCNTPQYCISGDIPSNSQWEKVDEEFRARNVIVSDINPGGQSDAGKLSFETIAGPGSLRRITFCTQEVNATEICNTQAGEIGIPAKRARSLIDNIRHEDTIAAQAATPSEKTSWNALTSHAVLGGAVGALTSYLCTQQLRPYLKEKGYTLNQQLAIETGLRFASLAISVGAAYLLESAKLTENSAWNLTTNAAANFFGQAMTAYATADSVNKPDSPMLSI